METRRPPVLDMTPEGEFTTPPPATAVDRAMGTVLRVALAVAGLAGIFLLASFALVAIAVLVPVLIMAALVAGGVLWWRVRKGPPAGAGQGGNASRVAQFVVIRRP